MWTAAGAHPSGLACAHACRARDDGRYSPRRFKGMMKTHAQRRAPTLELVLQPAGREPFDVLAAKLRVPAPRPGSVSRNALVNRLRAARAGGVVTVVAPAGYGKTTAL